MNERKIIIGLVISKKYLEGIKPIWDAKYIESSAAKKIAMWCWEHFNSHENAIGSDIGDKFFDELKKGKIPKEIAEELEEDILPSLSKQALKKPIRVKTLLKQTQEHFSKRKIELLNQETESLLSKGEIEKAGKLVQEYTPIEIEETSTLYFKDIEKTVKAIGNALSTQKENVIHFPKQAGKFFDEHFIKGGLVAFLGMTKVGKSWLLLDIAMRALKQKRKVAFFQAGDMNREEQLNRIAIYMAGKSNKSKYCKKHWEVVRDCIYNQTNQGCPNKKMKQKNETGLFQGENEDIVRKKTRDEIVTALEFDTAYKPCDMCNEYDTGKKGVPFLKKIKAVSALDKKQGEKTSREFLLKNGNEFMLETHQNSTLSVQKAKAKLDEWEKQKGFIPDVIIFDYADIMYGVGKDERERQKNIWQALRKLSQESYQPLVITVTQADADSYTKNTLGMKNFSEDRRKADYVTAMWGLNKDKEGRETELGILRVNELVLREGENSGRILHMAQNLKRGKALSQSYF